MLLISSNRIREVHNSCWGSLCQSWDVTEDVCIITGQSQLQKSKKMLKWRGNTNSHIKSLTNQAIEDEHEAQDSASENCIKKAPADHSRHSNFQGGISLLWNIKPDAIQEHSQNCTIEGNRIYWAWMHNDKFLACRTQIHLFKLYHWNQAHGTLEMDPCALLGRRVHPSSPCNNALTEEDVIGSLSGKEYKL